MHRLVDESLPAALARRLRQAIFAEREIMIRSRGRVRYLSLSRFIQSALFVMVVGAASWAGYASYAFVHLKASNLEKDREIELTLRVNVELREEMDEARRRFLAITGDLEKNHDHLVALVGQNKALKGNLVTLQRKLRTAEAKHRATQENSQTLRRRLSEVEYKAQQAQSRSEALKNDLYSTETQLYAALAEHTKERERGNALQSRVIKLRGRLETLSSAQKALLRRLTQAAAGDIDRVRKLIAQTGLKVEDLLAESTPRPGEKETAGQGGPFIPAELAEPLESFDQGLDAFNDQMSRWQDVQRLLGRLPLVSPMRRFRITSRFGRRRDPFNGRMAFHSGLDFAGPMQQKVRVTAPGRVVHAGRRGGYGRLVEVDHGLGIHTRYAHLSKVLVKRGQTVEFRDAVGMMGSSGRSTGPHLHYEIVVDGKMVDPIKFLRAGKHVFEG